MYNKVMDDLEISGKLYISSRKAAKQNKYHVDYIGQLVRSGKIVGIKVGRAWYVEAESLARYLGKDPEPASLEKSTAPVQLSKEVEGEKERVSHVSPVVFSRKVGLTYLSDTQEERPQPQGKPVLDGVPVKIHIKDAIEEKKPSKTSYLKVSVPHRIFPFKMIITLLIKVLFGLATVGVFVAIFFFSYLLSYRASVINTLETHSISF